MSYKSLTFWQIKEKFSISKLNEALDLATFEHEEDEERLFSKPKLINDVLQAAYLIGRVYPKTRIDEKKREIIRAGENSSAYANEFFVYADGFLACKNSSRVKPDIIVNEISKAYKKFSKDKLTIERMPLFHDKLAKKLYRNSSLIQLVTAVDVSEFGKHPPNPWGRNDDVARDINNDLAKIRILKAAAEKNHDIRDSEYVSNVVVAQGRVQKFEGVADGSRITVDAVNGNISFLDRVSKNRKEPFAMQVIAIVRKMIDESASKNEKPKPSG